MDPPPQAHIGVGHVLEYTMCACDGQLTSAVRSERVRVCAGSSGSVSGPPPRAASAAAYSSAYRTPLKAVTRCPSGLTSSTVWAVAPG